RASAPAPKRLRLSARASAPAPLELVEERHVLLDEEVLAGERLDVVAELVGQGLPRLLLPVEVGVGVGDRLERAVVDRDVSTEPGLAAQEVLGAGVEVLAHAVDVLVLPALLELRLRQDVHALQAAHELLGDLVDELRHQVAELLEGHDAVTASSNVSGASRRRTGACSAALA